jgi:hypothetical protein
MLCPMPEVMLTVGVEDLTGRSVQGLDVDSWKLVTDNSVC